MIKQFDSFLNKTTLLILHHLLLLVLCTGFASVSFGYEFSDVRKSLERDLEKWQGHASRNKIAIVYNNANRERIKKDHNLVRLKKDLSYELLKSFDIADPIIVNEIMKTNDLSYQQVAGNNYIQSQFADRAGSEHILLVDLKSGSGKLIADIRLVHKDNTQISKFQTEILPEAEQQVAYKTTKVTTQTSEPEESVFQAFNTDFTSRSFTAGQNESWMYFSPTAYVNPSMHSLSVVFWFKDFAEVDVKMVRARYALKFVEILQFGIQSYGIVEKTNSKAEVPNLKKEDGHHSTYASLKFLAVDETAIPANISIGLRRRLLWDGNNTDFRSRDREDEGTKAYEEAEEIDEKNDEYNQITLQAMVSGKIQPLGILYNLYLDNQTLGTGVKFVLTPDIKLFWDNVIYYYENANVNADSAFGAQFYNPYGSADLMYHVEGEQVQLGISFNF